MGGSEILLILVVVLMLFGSDKVPELARTIGKGMRQLRDATNEVKREINQSAYQKDLDESISKINQDMKKEVDKIKENIEEYTGSVKRTTKF